MCDSGWSNRDMFSFYTDCHINQPAYLFLHILVLLFSVYGVGYGFYHSLIQSRKEVALSATLLGGFYTLTYLIILGKNINLIDRNYGLNILHALGLAMIYFNINLTGFRHLEVVMSVDARTLSQSQEFYGLVKKVNWGVFWFTLIAELFVLILPTADGQLDFIDIVGPSSIVVAFINILPRTMYASQVQKIIVTAETEHNTKFYAPVKSQLKRIIYGSIYGWIFMTGVTLCWMLVPALRRNSYITYNIQQWTGTLTGIVNVRDTNSKRELLKGEAHGMSQNTTRQDGSQNGHTTGSKARASVALHSTVSPQPLAQDPLTSTMELSIKGGNQPSTQSPGGDRSASFFEETSPLVEGQGEGGVIIEMEGDSSPRTLQAPSSAPYPEQKTFDLEPSTIPSKDTQNGTNEEGSGPSLWNPFTYSATTTTPSTTHSLTVSLASAESSPVAGEQQNVLK